MATGCLPMAQMWVSQTYITNIRADGSITAYFVYEDYKDSHLRIEKLIRPKLESLGRSFGDSVQIFVPSKQDRASIGFEFTQWMKTTGRNFPLPGILILEYPLGDERSSNCDAGFVSLFPLVECSANLDQLVEELKLAFMEFQTEINAKKSGIDRILQNIQIKPGIWGLGYDLKPFVTDIVRRWWREPRYGTLMKLEAKDSSPKSKDQIKP
jgi:hypothetical protein